MFPFVAVKWCKYLIMRIILSLISKLVAVDTSKEGAVCVVMDPVNVK